MRCGKPGRDGETDPVASDESTEVSTTRRRRRPNRELLLISAAAGVGLFLVIAGFLSATTGRDLLDYPEAIIDISPAPNDRQVLSQTEISVDLQDGYEAVIVLDGIEIPTSRLEDIAGGLPEPGQQIDLPPTAIYDQGNSLIRFEPRDGAVIESYSVGRHQVTVIFWKIEDGRNTARSYSWSFEVL